MRGNGLLRKRLLLLSAVLALLFLAVCVRVGGLTLVEGETLTARGVSQWTREGVVEAKRGSIVDTNGKTLVMSAGAYSVSVNPQKVSDAEVFSKTLAPILNLQEATVKAKAEKKGYAAILLKRQVDRETVDEIRALRQSEEKTYSALKGIIFDEDAKRWYPKGAFLTQVLGLTNIDSVGQSGLEQQYDKLLSGEDGMMLEQVDAKARLLPDGVTAYVPSKDGCTLTLTVDSVIQAFVEKAMRECLAVNNAKSVTCIMMDVNTGAILAMCQKPDYDPNEPPRDDGDSLQTLMRITAISDAYEPGSTFKMLTASAALDSGATTPEEGFVCRGSIKVDGDLIRCWKNAHGAESMAQALQNSCNPVFVTLALRMGTDTLYRYLRAFGLGVRTEIDLPGEGEGILINAKYVKNVDLARIGFGQSVAVTPLQLITAGCAVVNGGRLLKPYLVKEIKSANGEIISRITPSVVSHPIKEETSKTMRLLLENVVALGGGKNAAISGYRIGGKTGTAQVYKNGKIVSDVHIGSFFGFAPADNPQFAILVIVNEADVPVDYGGTTAAPFARQIMADTLAYLGVKKSDPKATAQPMTRVPDVCHMTLKEARALLGGMGFLTETDGVSEQVSAQTPAAGALLPAGGTVMLYTYQDAPYVPNEMVCVPDVTGLSMVEAGRTMTARGLMMQMEGSGLAVSQSPSAGSYTTLGDTIIVIFKTP